MHRIKRRVVPTWTTTRKPNKTFTPLFPKRHSRGRKNRYFRLSNYLFLNVLFLVSNLYNIQYLIKQYFSYYYGRLLSLLVTIKQPQTHGNVDKYDDTFVIMYSRLVICYGIREYHVYKKITTFIFLNLKMDM